jgi:hypothetical protein
MTVPNMDSRRLRPSLRNKTGAALQSARIEVSDAPLALSAFGQSNTAKTRSTKLLLASPVSLDADVEARFPIFQAREVSLSRKLVVEGPGLARKVLKRCVTETS